MEGKQGREEGAEISSPSTITPRGELTATHGDASVAKELYGAAEERISELNKVGVAQGRTDINEPKRHHIPRIINMEEFEDWIKHAKEYAVDRRLKRGGDQVVGKEIDLNDILDDVSTPDGSMKTCRHSIVLASAGMGKTTLLRWIAQYGIQGTLKMLEGKLIVMPDFRTLPTDQKLHPSQALLGTMFKDQDSDRMKQRYQWMLENPDKVVFLIDSLDTLAFDFDTERPRIGHNTEALPEDILHNLLSRDLFPKSNIISTSREFKVRNMHPNVRPDRCLLIDGLKEESVQDLIGEFLGEEKGEEVKRHIKTECPDVGPLLVMPVFLVFGMIGFMASGFIPNTMSGILIKYYVSLIFSNHAQVKNIREALVRLMPMAFDGILKGQVLFSLEHFNSFGIDPKEVTDLGILIPFSTGNYLFSKLMQVDGFYLYFNHQTLQECLAALHILSLDLTKYKNLINTNLFKPNFIIVRRILCGTLLNPQVLEATKELMHIPDIDRKKSILLESLSTELEQQQQQQQQLQDERNTTCREKLLELFIDLNEAKSGATELIQSSVKKIDLHRISLSLNDIQSVGNVMKQCKYLLTVNLTLCSLTDEKMEILARTLNQSDLKFRELNVSYNKRLGPDGFCHLGKLIRQHEVQVLVAKECNIRSEAVMELSSGLGGAKFRELNVRLNEGLGPDGFHHVGKLIRQHEVQVLDASHCNITSGAVKELSSGLGGAKIKVLNLLDVSYPRYTEHLLDLPCHVEEKLDLTLWQINEDEQQQLQNRLNQIGSPSLTVVLGQPGHNRVLLKAFTADTASDSSASQDATDEEKLSWRMEKDLLSPISPDIDLDFEDSDSLSEIEEESDIEATDEVEGKTEVVSTKPNTSQEPRDEAALPWRSKESFLQPITPESQSSQDPDKNEEQQLEKIKLKLTLGARSTDVSGEFPKIESPIKSTTRESQQDILGESQSTDATPVTQGILDFHKDTAQILEADKKSMELLRTTLKESCKERAFKTQEISPAGGSIELHGCEIRFPLKAVKSKTDVTISVDNNPAHYPTSVRTISPILACKPSKFDTPVFVKLTSWFNAKAGKRIKVMILSKSSSQAEWKTIQEVALTDRNVVEYEVSHFCENTAAVTEKDGKEGLYRFFNDVWMHNQTARIVSYFCKDKKAFDEAENRLKRQQHTQIISLHGEVIVGMGSTMEAEVQCHSPSSLKINNFDGKTIKITEGELMKSVIQLQFCPNPHPATLQHRTYDLSYRVDLVNSQEQPMDGGFAIPLNYTWPVIQDLTHPEYRTGPQSIMTSQVSMTNQYYGPVDQSSSFRGSAIAQVAMPSSQPTTTRHGTYENYHVKDQSTPGPSGQTHQINTHDVPTTQNDVPVASRGQIAENRHQGLRKRNLPQQSQGNNEIDGLTSNDGRDDAGVKAHHRGMGAGRDININTINPSTMALVLLVFLLSIIIHLFLHYFLYL